MRKIFLVIGILALVLVLAAEYYIQTDRFAERIRPLVVERLKEVLGSDVRIGWVRANFVPAYIEARDISLSDENRKEVAAIHKITVYVNPFSLLRKKIRISSIVLLDPRIHAERAKDGTLNFMPIADRIRANISRIESQGTSGLTVVIGKITVKQGAISFDDALTSTRLTVSKIHLIVTLDVAGDGFKAVLNKAEIHSTAPAYNELAGEGKATIRYERGRIHIDSSELSSADTKISVTGDAGPLPDMPLNLRLTAKSGLQTLGKFTDVVKLIKKKEQNLQVEASATIAGNIARPEIEGRIKFNGVTYEGMQLQNADLSFGFNDNNLTLAGKQWKIARGNTGVTIDTINAAIGCRERAIEIKYLDILAGDLSVRLSGRVDTQKGFDTVVTAESSDKGETLSFLGSLPLPGKIGIKGSLSGAFLSPRFDGAFSAGPLTIRGLVFNHAEGDIRFQDKKISVASVDIRQQDSRYQFEGEADLSGKDTVFSARLKVIRSDVVSIVALFYKPIPLKLTAAGDLVFHGTARDFIGSGRLTIDSGSAYGESFTRATITAFLTKDRIEFPHVILSKGGGLARGTGWIGFDGSYSAKIEGHEVKLSDVDHLAGIPIDGRCRLEIGSSGTFAHPRVTASLGMDQIFFNRIEVGNFTAGLRISDGVMTVQSSVGGDGAEIAGRMELTKPYPWSVQAKVKSDGLDPFLAAGQKELLGRVRLDADGSMMIRGNGADASTISGGLSLHRFSILLGDYRVDNSSEIKAELRGDRINILSLALSGPGTEIAVSGGTGYLKDLDLAFTGTVNISLLKLLFPEVEYGAGTAEMKLAVRDEWKNPELTGELRVNNGDVKIKDIPQKFSGLKGLLTFDRSKIVVDSLTGEFGGGTLSGSGWAQLKGFALQDFSTHAAFENVTVRYPEGLGSTLSGNLYYDGDATEQSLTGDILIKRARYDKRVEWKSMLVDIGRGLYQRKKTEIGWIGDTQINIRFHGKENIAFQNNLAKMPLNVDVFLRGTVNQPQLLGRIEALKGTVYFRKNEFRILHASADFVDPHRMNPVLDIQAEIGVRDADREYRIRLSVSGNADRAVVTLASNPSLQDSDIFTLLAFGKIGTELKGHEAGVEMSEAYYFATGQIQDMIEGNARSLTGLDRFQVDPYVSKGDMSVPRVTVGKELVQDKLYVTYSSNVGSTIPEQIFRIEYILNRHFSLVGERNEIGNTGADLKYRFEFK